VSRSIPPEQPRRTGAAPNWRRRHDPRPQLGKRAAAGLPGVPRWSGPPPAPSIERLPFFLRTTSRVRRPGNPAGESPEILDTTLPLILSESGDSPSFSATQPRGTAPSHAFPDFRPGVLSFPCHAMGVRNPSSPATPGRAVPQVVATRICPRGVARRPPGSFLGTKLPGLLFGGSGHPLGESPDRSVSDRTIPPTLSPLGDSPLLATRSPEHRRYRLRLGSPPTQIALSGFKTISFSRRGTPLSQAKAKTALVIQEVGRRAQAFSLLEQPIPSAPVRSWALRPLVHASPPQEVDER